MCPGGLTNRSFFLIFSFSFHIFVFRPLCVKLSLDPTFPEVQRQSWPTALSLLGGGGLKPASNAMLHMRLSLLNPPSVWLISALGWAQLPWIQDTVRPPQKPLRVLGTLRAPSNAMLLIIFLVFNFYLSDSLSEKTDSFSSSLPHKGVPELGVLSKPSQIFDSGEEWEIRPLLWLQMKDSDLS